MGTGSEGEVEKILEDTGSVQLSPRSFLSLVVQAVRALLPAAKDKEPS